MNPRAEWAKNAPPVKKPGAYTAISENMKSARDEWQNSDQKNRFVKTLYNVSKMIDSKFTAADETHVAISREIGSDVQDVNHFRISLGREISRLLSSDTQRLTNILSRI